MKNTTPVEQAAKALIKHLDPMTVAAIAAYLQPVATSSPTANRESQELSDMLYKLQTADDKGHLSDQLWARR